MRNGRSGPGSEELLWGGADGLDERTRDVVGDGEMLILGLSRFCYLLAYAKDTE